MRIKGVTYDIGTMTIGGGLTRETLPLELVAHEMRVIVEQLHCNAVRITGHDLGRLGLAGRAAARQGLEVWLSPSLHEANEQETFAHVVEAAGVAEELRRSGDARVVMVVGCELSLFMSGLIPGNSGMERMAALSDPTRWTPEFFALGSPVDRLNTFLARMAAEVRNRFNGPVTYAAGLWEEIDWAPFDIIGIDAYRDAANAGGFRETVRGYLSHGKPVVATEFGCCTYAGSDALGSAGWTVVDRSAVPWRLGKPVVRDEGVQARYLTDLLSLFKEEGLAGAFVLTFVTPSYPSSRDARYDLDTASYSLVRTWPEHGAGQPWEPKESFHAVARIYSGNG